VKGQEGPDRQTIARGISHLPVRNRPLTAVVVLIRVRPSAETRNRGLDATCAPRRPERALARDGNCEKTRVFSVSHGFPCDTTQVEIISIDACPSHGICKVLPSLYTMSQAEGLRRWRLHLTPAGVKELHQDQVQHLHSKTGKHCLVSAVAWSCTGRCCTPSCQVTWPPLACTPPSATHMNLPLCCQAVRHGSTHTPQARG
jgi:hypothetical protein